MALSIVDMVNARLAEEPEPEKETTEKSVILDYLHANEVGDARLFNSLHDGAYTFDHAAATWHKWVGHHWQEDIKAETLSAGLDSVVEKYSEESMRQAWAATVAAKNGRTDEADEHAENQKALLGRIKALQSLSRRRNVLTLAAAGTGLTGNEWDSNPWLLGVSNGVIDLKTGEFRDGRPEDYIRTVAPTAWRGIDAKCPTWEKFISEVFGGDRDLTGYIHRLLGYGLIGDTLLHILVILWGQGRNGKGTLLETLKTVLGNICFKAESELLLEQKNPKQSGAPNSGLLSLRGKRFVWVSETNDGRRFNASLVKELVGGDTLNARGLYARHHVEFKPSHLLFLLTNFKPQAPAGDYALWQRIHLIPFELSFIDEPKKPNERKKDPDLPEKLRKEAPGILAWLVQGCMEWQRQGLNPPEAVRAATQKYQDEEDIIGHFFEAECLIADRQEIKFGDLHSRYKMWCVENGHREMGLKRFCDNIRARGFDEYGKRNKFFIGIGLLK